MVDEVRLAEARRHAEVKFGFYIHLGVYLAVIGALLFINLLTGPHYLWFVWPAMGWGIAIVLHGAKAFLFSRKKEEIIDSLTRRELDKQRSEYYGDG